ncbi:MAG: hypothetical protein ACXW3M_01290, partial [Rhodoplanes sp.]
VGRGIVRLSARRRQVALTKTSVGSASVALRGFWTKAPGGQLAYSVEEIVYLAVLINYFLHNAAAKPVWHQQCNNI